MVGLTHLRDFGVGLGGVGVLVEEIASATHNPREAKGLTPSCHQRSTGGD